MDLHVRTQICNLKESQDEVLGLFPDRHLKSPGSLYFYTPGTKFLLLLKVLQLSVCNLVYTSGTLGFWGRLTCPTYQRKIVHKREHTKLEEGPW